jgi:hypothetical protein
LSAFKIKGTNPQISLTTSKRMSIILLPSICPKTIEALQYLANQTNERRAKILMS